MLPTPIHRVIAILLVLGLLALLATQATLATSPTPRAAQPDFEVVSDIPYGTDHVYQVMDWYPAINGSGPHPVVVFVHPGMPPIHSKADVLNWHGEQAQQFLLQGFTLFATNYQDYFVDPLPAQVHDIGKAVQHIRHYADAYDIDPDRLFLWGGSGGANIAGALAYGVDLADPLGTPEQQWTTRPTAWINYRGTTDFPALDPSLPAAIFGYDQLGLVPMWLKQELSAAWLVCHVERSYTPPVLTIYDDVPAGTPPITPIHDPYFAQVLHGNLRLCANEAAQQSVRLYRGDHQVTKSNYQKITCWIAGLAGIDQPYIWGKRELEPQAPPGPKLPGPGGTLNL